MEKFGAQIEPLFQTICLEHDRSQRTTRLVSLPRFCHSVLARFADFHGATYYSVASAKTLEEAKKTPGCLYYAMPVQQFETLGGFSQFDEIKQVGLEAGRMILNKWKEEGTLPTGLVDGVKAESQALKRGARLR